MLAGGVAAAMHVGKLPPSLPALREHFGMTLVQASLLVSAFQVAGMSLGIVGGMLADRFGARRMMALGLLAVGLSSLAGAFATGVPAMLALRAIESGGFILAVLPGPALMRRVLPPDRVNVWLGYWGAYMPIGMGLALVASPWLIQAGGWPQAWVAAGLVSLAVSVLVRARVPADPPPAPGAARPRMLGLIGTTLRAPGPWICALGFGCYAAQWMGVFSFLPTIYQAAGLAPATAASLTAFATTINLVGNIAGGALAHRGVPAPAALTLAAVSMGGGAWLAFGSGAPFAAQYAGILMLTILGGLIPGTLFTVAPRLAPNPGTVSTTIGLMQQGSTLGQFLSPPMLAALASGPDGWTRSWLVTGLFAIGEIGAALLLWRVLRRRADAGAGRA